MNVNHLLGRDHLHQTTQLFQRAALRDNGRKSPSAWKRATAREAAEKTGKGKDGFTGFIRLPRVWV